MEHKTIQLFVPISTVMSAVKGNIIRRPVRIGQLLKLVGSVDLVSQPIKG